jgi:hypothetical protein
VSSTPQPMSPTMPENEDLTKNAILDFAHFITAVGRPLNFPLMYLLEEIRSRIVSLMTLDEPEVSPDNVGTRTQLETSLVITSFVSTRFEQINDAKKNAVKHGLLNIAHESHSATERLKINSTQESDHLSKKAVSMELSVEEIQDIIKDNLRRIQSAMPPKPRPDSVIEHSVVESIIEEIPRIEGLPVL